MKPQLSPVTASAVTETDTFIPSEREWVASLKKSEVMLPIADLNIAQDPQAPDAYQRLSDRKSMLSVKNSFAYLRFDRITVSQRPDGSYWVIDGGNRITGLRERGYTGRVPAHVVEMTAAEEAKWFVDLNAGRVPLSAFAVYNAELIAGDEWALKLKSLMAKHGLRLVPFLGDEVAAGDRAGVSTLKLMRRETESTLEGVIYLGATLFHADRALLTAGKYLRVLKAVLVSLGTQSAVSIVDVVEALKDRSFSELLRETNRVEEEFSFELSWTKCCLHAIQNLYNETASEPKKWVHNSGRGKAGRTRPGLVN